MGLILIFIIFPVAFVFFISVKLFRNKRLVISSSREVSGVFVKILAWIYLLIGIIATTQFFYFGDNLSASTKMYPLFGIIIVSATIVSVFFSKSRQP